MLKGQKLFSRVYSLLPVSLIRRCQLHQTNYGEHQRETFDLEFESNLIPTSIFQKTLLGIGSAALSILDPKRADMIAVMGETAGTSALKYMHSKMMASTEGQEVLKNKPRINSRTIDLAKLAYLPEGTFGKAYSTFLSVNKVTPDSRLPVRFIEDIELAYVIQRYREVHDIFHTLLDMPTNMLGEVTVKWVEAFQTRLPMCIGGALFGPLRLSPKQRVHYVNNYLPWAIETGTSCQFLMNVFYERRWEQSLTELRKELNIKPVRLIPKKKIK